MPLSPYVRSLRDRIGHELLLLPGVTAVVRERDRFLLVRQRDTQRWSLVGGGIEPGETPHEAVAREVSEELGVTPRTGRIVGAYGGPALQSTLPNGDQVAYVTVWRSSADYPAPHSRWSPLNCSRVLGSPSSRCARSTGTIGSTEFSLMPPAAGRNPSPINRPPYASRRHRNSCNHAVAWLDLPGLGDGIPLSGFAVAGRRCGRTCWHH